MVDVTDGATLTQYCMQDHEKTLDRWSFYIRVYDEVLAPYRPEALRLLEVGVQNGGSLAMWAQYFSAATTLVGCDIDAACAELHYDDPRIHVVVGDANADETTARIDAISPGGFDLVIDDGSHRSSDIVRSFLRYFPRLSDDGLFVAEDLHCSYWAEYEGGIFDPWSAMSFFKRLADIVNHEHWGVPHARSAILDSFRKRYDVAIDEAALASIHTVQFLNSMCLIRKRRSEHNVLGPRVVQGRKEVAEHLVARSGSASVAADQRGNSWSAFPPGNHPAVGGTSQPACRAGARPPPWTRDVRRPGRAAIVAVMRRAGVGWFGSAAGAAFLRADGRVVARGSPGRDPGARDLCRAASRAVPSGGRGRDQRLRAPSADLRRDAGLRDAGAMAAPRRGIAAGTILHGLGALRRGRPITGERAAGAAA